MPVTPTYPGVYIEEIPSGVHTITGVATSITAFIGYTQRGPTNEATQIFNFGDFERQFGGLASASDLSYAVQQYFLNGGNEAWIVRVASGAVSAAISLLDAPGGTDVLDVTAFSQGVWGNNLRINVDYDTTNPDSLFNLAVTELVDQNGTLQPANTETFRNLSMNSTVSNYAVDTINAGSALIQVQRTAAALAAVAAQDGTSTSGNNPNFAALDNDHRRLAITINGEGPYEFDLFDLGGSIASLAALATAIQNKVTVLSASAAFTGFTCAPSGTTIVATSGAAGEASAVHFANASLRNAATLLKLGLMNGGHEIDAVSIIRPTTTGTLSTDLSALNLGTLNTNATVNVSINVGAVAGPPITLPNLWALVLPASLEEVRSKLQTALNARPEAELHAAIVSLRANRLQVEAGGTNPNTFLTFANAGADTTATTLGLPSGAGAVDNVASYALGVGLTSQAQSGAIMGSDGTPPTTNDYIGDRPSKTGIFALENVDLFNILCIPNVSTNAVLTTALAYCDERRAFLIIDMDSTVDTLDKAKQWLTTNSNLRDNNSATYFPRIVASDPLQNFRLRPFAPSGALAGLYARTDSERGVWKAPAGTEAVLRAVQALTYKLTDPENGVLNPLGLNCLRTFPVFGNVSWGARTLNGSDVQASDWKYIPVRRFALFLEESLYRGTKWAVFEPNDEPLWAQIRLNIGAFMQSLFRQGAFQGKSPREAYFVKCDSETTTQTDINNGIVNIVVGFAPLKPAEFVILKIQQIAGQIPT